MAAVLATTTVVGAARFWEHLMPIEGVGPDREDRIEEAAREIYQGLEPPEDRSAVARVVFDAIVKPILQRLYDDGKKAGAEEERAAVEARRRQVDEAIRERSNAK